VKLCVVGAGAIGGWTAAWMARAGHEVSLVARGAHLEALRRGGLTLVSAGGRATHALPASSDPADFGVQDAVFVCLKTPSIAAMLPRIAPLVGPGTIVVPAINGLPWWYFYKAGGASDGAVIECLDPERRMFAALDPRHIVGCVVHAAAEVAAPGVVVHTAGKRLILGEPDGSRSARALRLAAAMAEAGFDAPVVPDIRVEIWVKLVGNLSYNPVAALTLAGMHEINANAGLLALIGTMIEEAMRVAEAYGIRVPMSVEERIAIAKKLGNAKISMHQDVERRRPLEVEAIIGSVAELARKAGIATPMIDAVHALVAERARHLEAYNGPATLARGE
jgi:2-dehydropantoate 2-reductase